MLREDSAPYTPEEHRRFGAAIQMLFRHLREGKPLEQCWAEVHPDSKLDPEAARKRAAEELDWRRRNHPLRISEALLLYGLDTDDLLDDLGKQLEATKKVPVKVIREGGRVTFRETIEVPDYRARNLALDQLIEIRRPELDPSFPELDPSFIDRIRRRAGTSSDPRPAARPSPARPDAGRAAAR